MCECEKAQLGYLDGDLESIYCAVCELVIGRWDDLVISKEIITV